MGMMFKGGVSVTLQYTENVHIERNWQIELEKHLFFFLAAIISGGMIAE